MSEEREKRNKNIGKSLRERYKRLTGFSSYKEKRQASHICSVCGAKHGECLNPHICKSAFLRQKSKNLAKLGFDLSKIGTKDVIGEYERIQQLLKHLYYDEEVSMPLIMKRYGIPSLRTMFLLFKFFDIPPRTLSEAQTIVVLQNKSITPKMVSPRFKHGFHTTWDNKVVFYRSSYELDYMEQLDASHEPYEIEAIRIKYFDTVKKKWRVAIPDVYLPNTNTIVEIKSEYTYDKQNMIDKSNAYKANGYKFKLILEHVEYDDF